MSKIINPNEQDTGVVKAMTDPMHRRSFFKYISAGAALSTLLLVGCEDDDDGKFDGTDTGANEVDLGSGDVGVLNYAYALEQLEAAFYTQVVGAANFSTLFTSATERQILTDIRDHEVAHREFFKAAINATAPGRIIPNLTPNFPASALASRTSILETARTFEDLGVAAYNGAGKLLQSATFLGLAGKIVSVEARHAAEIRDIIQNGTFSDTANNTNGFDVVAMPKDVLAAAGGFIKEKINANNLPTS